MPSAPFAADLAAERHRRLTTAELGELCALLDELTQELPMMEAALRELDARTPTEAESAAARARAEAEHEAFLREMAAAEAEEAAWDAEIAERRAATKRLLGPRLAWKLLGL